MREKFVFKNAEGVALGVAAIRVLVVDDYEPWRRFVSTTLRKEPELQIVGQASDGLEAVQQAENLQPDLILLDIGLPSLNGIEAARRIREVSPTSKIIFVSENSSQDIVEAALRTGASGFVVKSNAASELFPAIETVLHEKQLVSAGATVHNLIDRADEHAADSARRAKVVTPCRHENGKINGHELRICSDDSAFVDEFAHSVETALENGSAVVVIATESHRVRILQKLSSDGVEVGAAAERKLYIPLDVADSLSAFMVDVSTDGDGFPQGLPYLMREAVRTAKEQHLHVAVG